MEPATSTSSTTTVVVATTSLITPMRKFSCKYCDKQFDLAAALGGHMTLHRNARARAMDAGGKTEGSPKEPTFVKYYHCKHCDEKFDISQALGGHMTRHRARRAGNEVKGVEMIDFFATEESSTMEVVEFSKNNYLEEMDLISKVGKCSTSPRSENPVAIYKGDYGGEPVIDSTLRICSWSF